MSAFKKMKVYRLEYRNEGVFSSGVIYKAMQAMEAKMGLWAADEPNPYRHPSPDNDVLGWAAHPDMYKFYCGFRSIEQLLRWFDSEALRVALNVVGVEMKVYEVAERDVLSGVMQIMFKKCNAQLIETLPVPTVMG